MKSKPKRTSKTAVSPQQSVVPPDALPLFGRLDLQRLVEVVDQLTTQLDANGAGAGGVDRPSSERPLKLFDAQIVLSAGGEAPLPSLLCIRRVRSLRPKSAGVAGFPGRDGLETQEAEHEEDTP